VEPHLHVQTINSFSIQDSLIFIITLFYNPSPSTSGTFLSKLLQMQQHQQQQLLPQVPTGESASWIRHGKPQAQMKCGSLVCGK
jgi:hypothetical protein